MFNVLGLALLERFKLHRAMIVEKSEHLLGLWAETVHG